ncbi:MAG: DUF5662 family protein, partial [Anaerolineales bacterium]|nr:DUF5662 family protein [Anaerolineales bacterium]
KKPPNGKNGNGKVVVDGEHLLLDQRHRALVRHITHVQQSCSLLGERLVSEGERGIGHKLIANGFIHDNSKFHGIEWLYLHDDVLASDPELFKAALIQHTSLNPHHPEHWNGIEQMPRLYMAEMVCDWHARSGEFGADLRTFIKERATKKFDFSTSGKIYKEIKGLVDLLLDPAFV